MFSFKYRLLNVRAQDGDVWPGAKAAPRDRPHFGTIALWPAYGVGKLGVSRTFPVVRLKQSLMAMSTDQVATLHTFGSSYDIRFQIWRRYSQWR